MRSIPHDSDDNRKHHPSSGAPGGLSPEERYQLALSEWLAGRECADEASTFIGAHPLLLALRRLVDLAEAHPEALGEVSLVIGDKACELLDVVVAEHRAAAAARARSAEWFQLEVVA